MTSGENNETVLPEQTINSDQKTTPSHLVTALQREHNDWITEIIEAHREVTAIVPAQHIVAVCAALKAHAEAKFDFLADICGADRGVEEEPRFEVNYHLFSTKHFNRLRLKVLSLQVSCPVFQDWHLRSQKLPSPHQRCLLQELFQCLLISIPFVPAIPLRP